MFDYYHILHGARTWPQVSISIIRLASGTKLINRKRIKICMQYASFQTTHRGRCLHYISYLKLFSLPPYVAAVLFELQCCQLGEFPAKFSGIHF